MNSKKGQNNHKQYLPRCLSILTPPQYPIKKWLAQNYSNNEEIVIVDIKELPSLDLLSVYQLLAYALGSKIETNNEIIVFQELKKRIILSIQPLPIFFLHTNLLLPIYESFFMNLESLYEEYEQLHFIFHFDHNILTERIHRQLINHQLPFQNISILPYDNYEVTDWSRFFYQLVENEQVILREIFSGSLDLRPAIEPDLKYLIDTGIIAVNKKRYVIKISNVEQFLFSQSRNNLVGEFTIISDGIFYDGTNIENKLSVLQKKILTFLISNQDRLITLDELIREMWGESGDITNWAFDKAVARLISKLIKICGCNPIQRIKGKGIIFKDQKINKQLPMEINSDTLTFRKMIADDKTVDFFYRVFNNPADNQYLFSATPKTRNEIKSWILNSTQSACYDYDNVYYQGKLVGSVGLKDINTVKKISGFGTVLSPYDLWDEIGMKVFKHIIDMAESRGIKHISYHPNKNNWKERAVAGKVGFKSAVGDEGKLYMEL